MRKLKWLGLAALCAVLVGYATFYLVNAYILDQAEKNVRDILLSHRGVHLYIQRTMHKEFYRARDNAEIPIDYYAPEILSSSFMVRVLHGYYNEEREKEGLTSVYYKMAADNPRNPVNAADAEERRLLEHFRNNPDQNEFSAIEKIDGREYLVFAKPFLRNEKRCLVCHGKREDAPQGLQARYAGLGGFNETEGSLRAIETLRVPIDRERLAALVASLSVFVGLAVIAALFVFNRSLTGAVRRKTEEIGARERAFRRMLDAADAVPFEYSPVEDEYTYVGEQFSKVFGGSPESLKKSADWNSLVHPDDRDGPLRTCREATTRLEDHDCEMRVLRPDGKTVLIHQTVNIIKEEGKPPQAVGFIHDVTAWKRSEKLQKARLRIARTSVEESLGALIGALLDESERLTESAISFFHFVNEDQKNIALHQWSDRTLTVCQAPDAVGHYPVEKAGVWADALRKGTPTIDNDYRHVKEISEGLPKGHVPLTRHLVCPLRQGGRIVALIGVGNKKTPYDDLDVEAIAQLGEFALEIIMRKRAEEANKKIQAQLIQAQKVEAIGRLAGGVAHDFNNMLGVILGHAELLLLQIPESSQHHEDLIEIKKAAERSSSITRQLLAFARQQIATPKLIDLNEAIDGMLKMLRRLIGEDIDLVWKPRGGLGKVLIDPSQVDQILANLMTNARDAINGVGKVTIETQAATIDNETAMSHHEMIPGRYVMLGVSDSGKGIPKEELGKIFEPFYTTKAAGHGTGLGLATVYGIVQQNKGFINVYSEPGEGTTFRIYLMEAAPFETGAAEPIAAKEVKGGAETILVVEDEVGILNLAEKILTTKGYGVLAAQNPEEALAKASSHEGVIALLVTDVVMPEMHGKELYGKLREFRPQLKCVYMSGYTADVIAHRGILEEGVNFMPKPFKADELCAKVREVLDK